jgi:hypothetical protein
MKPYHVAGLTLLSWTLLLTEPSPRTIKTGLPTKEACERARDTWRASYKRQLKQANANNYPSRRRRLAQAIPPTKCVEDANLPPPHP